MRQHVSTHLDHIINHFLSLVADWDITVMCGTDNIHLSILLCPVYYAGFNETLIALNGKLNTSACLGATDLTASTPVLKFNFSLSAEEISLCDNSFEVNVILSFFSCKKNRNKCLCKKVCIVTPKMNFSSRS